MSGARDALFPALRDTVSVNIFPLVSVSLLGKGDIQWTWFWSLWKINLHDRSDCQGHETVGYVETVVEPDRRLTYAVISHDPLGPKPHEECFFFIIELVCVFLSAWWYEEVCMGYGYYVLWAGPDKLG